MIFACYCYIKCKIRYEIGSITVTQIVIKINHTCVLEYDNNNFDKPKQASF